MKKCLILTIVITTLFCFKKAALLSQSAARIDAMITATELAKTNQEAALEIADSLAAAATDSITIDALELGARIYKKKKEYAAEIASLEKIIELGDRFPAWINQDSSQLLYDLGTAFLAVYRESEAKLLFQNALAALDVEDKKDPELRIKIHLQLSQVGLRKKDELLAVSSAKMAVAILERFVSATNALRAGTYTKASDVIKGFRVNVDGWLTKAEKYARADNDLSQLSSIETRRALVHWAAEDWNAAEAAYIRSARFAREGGASDRDVFIIYHNLAALMYNIGRDERALVACTEALDSYPDPTVEDRFSSLGLKAAIQTALGKNEEALMTYNQTMLVVDEDAAKDSEGLIYPEPTDSPKLNNLIFTNYYWRANCLHKMGRIDAALKDNRYSRELMQSIRSRVSETAQFRAGDYFATSISSALPIYYDRYEERGRDQPTAWEALVVADQANAFSLIKSPQLLAREAALRKKKILPEIATLKRVDPESTHLLRLQMELEKITEQGDSNLIVTPQLDTSALKEWVASKQMDMLLYHTGRQKSYLFHLSPSGNITFYTIPINAQQLRGKIEAWRESIRSGAYIETRLNQLPEGLRSDSTFITLGRELNKLLLPADLLLGGRVCIVPDGPLHQLPFAALPALGTDSSNVDYQQLTYQLANERISYAYSIQHQLSLTANSKATYNVNQQFAFAPQYSGSSQPLSIVRSRAADSVDVTLRDGLIPLRYNLKEINQVADIIPSLEKKVGGLASKQSFLTVLSKADLVHVAGHGIADTENPIYGFIAFSSQPSDTALDQSLLYYEDIRSLPINAEIVVLSACETNLGKPTLGEAPQSLSYAFIEAGARSTLTSLWQIDDQATSVMITSFYDALYSGEDRATALQTAQRKLAKSSEYAHPYYWSGFVLSGRTGPINFSQPTARWWYLAGGMFIACLVLIVYAKR